MTSEIKDIHLKKYIRIPCDMKSGISLLIFLGNYLKDNHNAFLFDRRFNHSSYKETDPIPLKIDTNIDINFNYKDSEFNIHFHIISDRVKELRGGNIGRFTEMVIYNDTIKNTKQLIMDATEYYDHVILDKDEKEEDIIIYYYDEIWSVLKRKLKRPIDTIYLPKDSKNNVLEFIKKFISEETKQKYNRMGISYKANVLFEGLPGTGKTSFIFSLASHFGYNVAVINFDRKIDDTTFIKALKDIPNKSILILEDIDVLFQERKKSDEYKNMISFSVLLNALDGMSSKDGLITFMTTNYVDHLDSALIRPGRIDHFVKFGYANKDQTHEMFNNFFPNNSEIFTSLWKKIECKKFTTAMLQQFFFMYSEDPDELLNNIKKLDNTVENLNSNSIEKNSMYS
tara:strand:+ start:613 stop:1806 length:1194 start_codon:yes stop_codon:yes gene_type:complete